MFKIKRVRTMLRLAKRRLQRRLTIDDISTDVSFLYPPPDGGWGWVVVLAAFVHSMMITGFHNAFGVYMLSLLENFQSSNSQIGRSSSHFNLGWLILLQCHPKKNDSCLNPLELVGLEGYNCLVLHSNIK